VSAAETAPQADAPPTKSAKRDLSLYWWGQTTSAFGSVFSAVAMPIIAVVYLGASPVQMGLISAAAIVPMMLFSLPAGALADRIRRPRRTLMLLDLVSALAVGALAAGVATHSATIAWLIGLNMVGGLTSVLLEVIYFLHLNQLAGAPNIGTARARLQAGAYGAAMLGRLLVGPAIVLAGPASALSVDAISYLLSIAALLGMTPAEPVRPAPRPESGGGLRATLREMGGGLSFFVGDAFHRSVLIFLLVPSTAMAGAGVLTAPFLLRVVHVPTAAYGTLFIGSSLLGLAGSKVAGRVLGPGHDPRRVLLITFTAGAVCSLLLPLSFGPLPVAAACAALGLAVPVFFGAITNVALSPVLVADVEEGAMGRTMAMLQLFGAASGLIGSLGGGLLGSWLGVREAILTLDGGALAAIALCLPQAARAARRLREQTRPAPADLVVATGLIEE
jgi:MFS family permease